MLKALVIILTALARFAVMALRAGLEARQQREAGRDDADKAQLESAADAARVAAAARERLAADPSFAAGVRERFTDTATPPGETSDKRG